MAVALPNDSPEFFYEDIPVGYASRSPGRTITEADIVNFAGFSGDFHVIHTDKEFASATPFGQRIAHGMLGLSVATGLAARMPNSERMRLVAFLGLEWNFKNPVFIGDTIHVEQTVTSKRETKNPLFGVVVYDVRVIKQTGEVCQEGQWKAMYLRRGEG